MRGTKQSLCSVGWTSCGAICSPGCPAMNEIIKVEDRQIGDGSVHTINARELHTFLEVHTKFKDWIARRIADYGFMEGSNFCSF